MPQASRPIHPVVLAGGSGTRLWPLSRALLPKQFLPLHSSETLLQQAARRLSDPARYAPPLLVCNEAHRFVLAEQLRAIDVKPAGILLEPEGRNTAPAAAVAALWLAEEEPEALMLVAPADHVIGDVEALNDAIDRATALARAGRLVTFGVEPSGAATGYGYICRGPELPEGGAFAVERFVEKPDAETAKGYLESGAYYWNSGMFLFTAKAYLGELSRLKPAIVEACRKAFAESRRDLDFLRLGPDAFRACESDSIDYAVMEKTKQAAVVPGDFGWSDVGSWEALWALGEKDEANNVLVGETLAVDSRNSYLRAEKGLVAAIGVEDLAVISTGDAVLVAPRSRVEEVKGLVERLESEDRAEALSHAKEYRPWGSFEGIRKGSNFQVKHLVIKPGGKLSLQTHKHRAEHWVVVRGQATVTRGEETFTLDPDQSTYIPMGEVHSLENKGDEPLEVIEVQSGSYLGEDDIVRLEDLYGRS